MSQNITRLIVILTVINVICAILGIFGAYKIVTNETDIVYIQNNATEKSTTILVNNSIIHNNTQVTSDSPVLQHILGGGREISAFECVAWGEARCDEYDNFMCNNGTFAWRVNYYEANGLGEYLCVKD